MGIRIIILVMLFQSGSLWARNIAIVGDSHTVGYFGQKLEKLLTEQGPTARYAVVGAKSSDWSRAKLCPISDKCSLGPGYVRPLQEGDSSFSKRPPVDFSGVSGIQNFNQFDLVVFALGTNDAVNTCLLNPAVENKTVKRLVSNLKQNQKCIWVSPPDYIKGPVIKTCGEQGYFSYLNNLEASVKSLGCKYINTRLIKSRGVRALKDIQTTDDCLRKTGEASLQADANDQLHFSKLNGEYWATCAALLIKAAQ